MPELDKEASKNIFLPSSATALNGTAGAKPFGTGAITVNPGGMVRLAAPTNAGTAASGPGSLTINSDGANLGVLGLQYNGALPSNVTWNRNGGPFDGREPLRLEHAEIGLLFAAASLDWSLIDPTIFGTLFERFLDPDKRAQIGAHYTDPDKIMMIVEPVVARPLRAEWATAKAEIEAIMAPALAASAGAGKAASQNLAKRFEAARAKAEARRDAFIDRLCGLRILDPACGSGNFLYLALQAVKDIEYRAILECETLGLVMIVPRVGPEILHGVEINPFAAELARTTIWIGDIQWRVKNAITHHPRPILRKLDAIECRDALLTKVGESRLAKSNSALPVMAGLDPAIHAPGKRTAAWMPGTRPGMTADGANAKSSSDYVEASWPEADFIVGNPPFLGGKLLRRGLGDDNVEALFRVYEGRVPAEADLVCYWFAKAWEALQAGRAKRVGLVSTNSIRGGANRKVLEPIAEAGAIFEAWSDEPWTIDGAAVRVSLVCFSGGSVSSRRPHPEPPASAGESKDEGGHAVPEPARHAPSPFETAAAPPPQGEGVVDLGAVEVGRLDGQPVARIHADLTAALADLTHARRLVECSKESFQGITKGAPFEVDREIALTWLTAPINPNSRPNSDVLRPIVSGGDIAQCREASWVIDFTEFAENEAALYELPFEYAAEHVKPARIINRRKHYRERWWLFAEVRSGFRAAIKEKTRYLATPKVSRHRFFVWLSSVVVPDNLVVAVARDDDAYFGILNSRFHEAWSLALGAWIGSGNDPTYTPTTTFETFPFPAGLTPNIPAADTAADPRAQRIAAAARTLDDLRRAWLNPPDLVEIVPEVTPTAAPGEAPRRYPDRILPKTVEAAVKLKERTLTNLYNQRPRWLADAHDALDRAVAAAYGWPEDIAIDEALQRLLALNLERADIPSPRARGEG